MIMTTASGCTEDHCDCSPQGVTVSIAKGYLIDSIMLSGDACNGVEVLCAGNTPLRGPKCPTEYHYINPTREGECTIQIDQGDFIVLNERLNIVEYDGCCNGLFVEDGPNNFFLPEQ